MISSVFALLIIAFSFYFVFKNKKALILIQILFGPGADSFGVSQWIQLNSFYYYGILMNFSLFLGFLVSLSNSKNSSSFQKYNINTIYTYIFFVIFSTLVIWAINGFSYSFVQLFSNLVIHVPLVSLIIINCKYKGTDVYKMLKFIVYYQLSLSFLIIYSPILDINLFEQFNGANYLLEDNYYLNKEQVTFDSYNTVLTSISNFSKTAQFHNSNVLGFYTGLGIFIAIYEIFFRDKKSNLITYIFLLISCILWLNAGSKSPIISIFLAVFSYIVFLSKNKYIAVLIIFVILILYQSVASSEFLTFVFMAKDNSSLVERLDLINSALSYMSNNFFFGSGGRRDGIIGSQHIFPHQLFLLKGVLFGFVPLITSFLFVYVNTFVLFVKSKKKSFLNIGLLFFIVLISLANNETSPGLFWLIFALYNVDLV